METTSDLYLYLEINCAQKVAEVSKGVGGQRGLARGILPTPEIQASFLRAFSYSAAPLWEARTQFWGTIVAAFWGLSVANPSRQTSAKICL